MVCDVYCQMHSLCMLTFRHNFYLFYIQLDLGVVQKLFYYIYQASGIILILFQELLAGAQWLPKYSIHETRTFRHAKVYLCLVIVVSEVSRFLIHLVSLYWSISTYSFGVLNPGSDLLLQDSANMQASCCILGISLWVVRWLNYLARLTPVVRCILGCEV